jgi:hypothetical protein
MEVAGGAHAHRGIKTKRNLTAPRITNIHLSPDRTDRVIGWLQLWAWRLPEVGAAKLSSAPSDGHGIPERPYLRTSAVIVKQPQAAPIGGSCATAWPPASFCNEVGRGPTIRQPLQRLGRAAARARRPKRIIQGIARSAAIADVPRVHDGLHKYSGTIAIVS